MAPITFPSNIFSSSASFASNHLNHALKGKNIRSLTSEERNSINDDIRKTSSSEYRRFIKNAILANLIGTIILSLVLFFPVATTILASTFIGVTIVNASVFALSSTISLVALRKLYFLYQDFIFNNVTVSKHNYQALIHAARQVKKVNLRAIDLPAQDKENILEMIKEIENSIIPDRYKLTDLGTKIADSAAKNDSLAEILAYVLTDPEIHSHLENILSSWTKKTLVVWGIKYITSGAQVQEQINKNIPKFAKLVCQDEGTIRNIIQSKNWAGLIDLLVY